jgi:hypothetical protein
VPPFLRSVYRAGHTSETMALSWDCGQDDDQALMQCEPKQKRDADGAYGTCAASAVWNVQCWPGVDRYVTDLCEAGTTFDSDGLEEPRAPLAQCCDARCVPRDFGSNASEAQDARRVGRLNFSGLGIQVSLPFPCVIDPS